MKRAFLVAITPIFGAVPHETYPSLNDGYEYGVPREVVMTEEDFEHAFYVRPEQFDYRIVGQLPAESKIC